MSFSLKILGSSSSGNCGLLIVDGVCFLVDAGFSGKKIKEKLQPLGIKISDICGVFITHEHHDHVQGLKALAKFQHIKFYANFKTAQAIESHYHLNASWKIFETGKNFSINLLEVQSFSILHDAADPVGFIFRTKNDCCAWATDTGCLTEKIISKLIQSNILVVEANHDQGMLWNHPTRPYYLKERVAGDLGHLSNQEVYKLLKQYPKQWKQIILLHVSKDCNSVQLLKNMFMPLAQKNQFLLEIIDPVLNG